MMTVEDKPDVTYNDGGGCKKQIEKMREVVELPMLHPEKFVKLGIDPPKGVLCYGPPGTGKTLLARAVANRTDACFIRVIGSELVQKWQDPKSQMQLVVLDLMMGNQLDGFDARGNIKVIMATNTPDTTLLRPGRLDRKVEFGLPNMESRTRIFKIHTRTMNCERDVRFELLARLCPNSTGADIRSVCTEAGMYAITCCTTDLAAGNQRHGHGIVICFLSGVPIVISNDTLARLTKTVMALKEDKKQRLKNVWHFPTPYVS
ncbi:unnamed protein product [Lactuca virosa]|uniref:AAA+ ATPase domain-containing protein n=1 Tax=Lactuca virosa TaxID=75947 RepID=A0AAU9LDA6_9ASTR|nr:unnamed protein product [Lactuca virosa]